MLKYFLLLSIIVGLCACGVPENSTSLDMQENLGQKVYIKNCVMCHGKEGNLNAMNARDLTVSMLSLAETEQAIAEGSPDKGMPAYGPRLSEEELTALTNYVMQLRK